ncbi:MAG: hypothetical protein QF440_00150 [Candidatus Thalassarchaeaceae archaeon]|jgi:hypothetical protein|nr:hypothetical protein [Candidatus Thalassarchaeaceae archaeon]
MSEDWEISWSHQVEGRVGAICCVGEDSLIAAGNIVRRLNSDGDFIWRREFSFDVYRLAHDGTNMAVLAGSAFFILDLSTGEPIGEGRSVAGGFRDVIVRPGGGWVLADRGDHIHLFNRRGRGIRRLRPGSLMKMIGWLDRELLLAQDADGCMRALRLGGDDAQRKIESIRWSWISELQEGRLVVQKIDGSLYEGVPNPFGWDQLERIPGDGLIPISAAWTGEGWWTLDVSCDLIRLPMSDDSIRHPAGDLLVSNKVDRMLTSTRDGLVRMWVAPHLASRRRLLFEEIATGEIRRLDWEQRQVIFEAARDAEENGMLSRAIELYDSLGRADDVHRLISLREGYDE